MIKEKLELLRSLIRLREAVDSFIGLLSPAESVSEEVLRQRYALFVAGRGRLRRREKMPFVFSALLCYSPCGLAGRISRRGFVAKLARVCGLNRSSVSGTIRSLIFQYEHYKDFRLEVERCLAGVFGGDFQAVTSKKEGK